MSYSIRQAARMVGLSRKTLYSHVSQGKLSVTSDHEGNKTVDKSELLRVYGKLVETDIDKGGSHSVQEDVSEVGLLQKKLATARNSQILMHTNLKAAERENKLLRQLLTESRQREKDLTKKHEQTLSIFERLLPGKKKRKKSNSET